MQTQLHLPALSLGDQGISVSLLQRMLVLYGYHTILGSNPVDGYFSSKTYEAVKAFQGDHYLRKDGYVGVLTWKAMAYPSANPNLI